MLLNTAFLKLHFDEIVTMLTSTESDFDVLCFTETKIKEGSDIVVNIDIPGYTFFHAPTIFFVGGTLIFVENEFSPKLLPEFSQSVEKSFESTFIEIRKRQKQIVSNWNNI